VRLSLHGGSLLAGFRPGLVTTRLPRAVRSRRSQISTATGTSPLKIDNLVTAEREKAFIRYRANIEALEELLGFLYAECCTRNKAVEPKKIAAICR
jgi:hypothetical protein